MFEGDGQTRRHVVLAAAGAATSLAGCSLSSDSGPTVEVVENAFEGDVELVDHEVEEGVIVNVEAVVLSGTARNLTDESIRVAIEATFYDADGGVVGRDGASFTGTRVRPDDPRRYDRAVQGQLENVDRIEVRVQFPER